MLTFLISAVAWAAAFGAIARFFYNASPRRDA